MSKHFLTQAAFKQLMREQVSSPTEADANEQWATTVYTITKDGGLLVSPTAAFPTLTKVEAHSGWTFEA